MKISIAEIQADVAAYYNLQVENMIGQSREMKFCHPRMVAMYLARNWTGKSYTVIAKSFGGRNHATVIHAVKKIKSLMGSDITIRRDVLRLVRTIKNNPDIKGPAFVGIQTKLYKDIAAMQKKLEEMKKTLASLSENELKEIRKWR